MIEPLGIDSVVVRPDRTSVFAQYTLFIDDRDECQKRMAEADVPTAVHYPIPLNEQPAYRDLCCPDCTPVASAVARRVISLPMSADLAAEDQDRVVNALAEATQNAVAASM